MSTETNRFCLTCVSLSLSPSVSLVSWCVFSANYRKPASVLPGSQQGPASPPARPETLCRLCKRTATWDKHGGGRGFSLMICVSLCIMMFFRRAPFRQRSNVNSTKSSCRISATLTTSSAPSTSMRRSAAPSVYYNTIRPSLHDEKCQ